MRCSELPILCSMCERNTGLSSHVPLSAPLASFAGSRFLTSCMSHPFTRPETPPPGHHLRKIKKTKILKQPNNREDSSHSPKDPERFPNESQTTSDRFPNGPERPPNEPIGKDFHANCYEGPLTERNRSNAQSSIRSNVRSNVRLI